MTTTPILLYNRIERSKSIREACVNLEEARKVIRVKNMPRWLGKLLVDGCLPRERLEWAAQWAYTSRLRQAANLLLDSMLNAQPGSVKQVQPERDSSSDASFFIA
ncbi:MAG: hypothetical protein JXB85_01165 [Anaerolineales bacterium]|nr:hypothetical protein [Anaerolineales bacterium]